MDRTNIIRNRIADLRSEKYAYLTEYISDGDNCYEYPKTEAADEWKSLLEYLEKSVLAKGLEYNVAEEQKYINFAKIYTGESLKEFIDAILKQDTKPNMDNNAFSELSEYMSCTETYYDNWAPIDKSICCIHNSLDYPALPFIAKYINNQGEEELYRSALIVLDCEKILRTYIKESHDSHTEHQMFNTLKVRMENLRDFGYDRIYLYNIGALREFFLGENLFEAFKVPFTYLGIRIIMSGCLSYFVERVIQQNDRYANKMPYGYIIYPPKSTEYYRVSGIKELPQLTPEEIKHIEDVVRSTAIEVFYTDTLLTYQSQNDLWWNRLLKYDSRLKCLTRQFPSWMIQLIEFYILHTLLSVCDTGEVRERIKRYKDMKLESLPEQFQDKVFAGDPYEDPIFEIVRSTGIVSEMDDTETNRDSHYVLIPEVAAYYLQKARSPHLS